VLEVEDVRAAVAFIDDRPDLCRLPLGVFGISRGGSVALVAAAQCDSIHRVVSDGAYCCNEMLLHFTNRWGRLYFPEQLLRLLPKWHVQISLWLIRRTSELRRGVKYANIERALSLLGNKRVLMISGERDTYVFPEVTRHLHARTGQDDSTVWIVPDAKHNMSRQADPIEYDRRLVEFFSTLEPVPANFQVNSSVNTSGESSVAVAAGDSSMVGVSGSGNGNGRPVLVHNRPSLSSSG
jgi:pimeloyl-ACP methyl ester carboxylesterase